MVIASLYAGLNPAIDSFRNFGLSGLFAFAAALCLLPDTGTPQRIQLGVLVSIGLALLLFALSRGAAINWSAILSQNTGILSMVLSVGLLKLIFSKDSTKAATEKEKLPIGRKAFFHTLMSLTIFGSVINISAAILVGDRLTLNRPMNYFTAGTITRAYSGCAAFSPFFGCMAVALTAVGDFELLSVMANGVPFTIASVAVLYFSGVWRHKEKLDSFYGYPLRAESLFVPTVLAIIVFVMNMVMPNVPVLTIIALSSIALTVVLLIMRYGVNPSTDRLVDFVKVDLPKSLNEVQLFISAGILASGLQALIQIGSLSAPIDEFTSTTACLLLALMIVVSALGIHPVIQIVTVAPLILATNPDPELLGLTFLFSWALGTQASPLSGTNLIMQGRYNIVAWRGAMQNWPFVGFMYFIAGALLMVRGWLG